MANINIILLGESGVGKTTLLVRFITGEFRRSEATCKPVDWQLKNIVLEGREVTITIWDTGGQERFRSVSRNYYREKDGVLLIYDVSNPDTYYKLASWLCELRDQNEDAEILIAGNKDDDPTKKAVAVNAVKRFAEEKNIEYMEMSAKSGKNVEEAFLRLAKKILIKKGIFTDKAANSDNQVVIYQLDSSSSKGSLANIPPRTASEDCDIIRLEASTKIQRRKKIQKKKKSCC